MIFVIANGGCKAICIFFPGFSVLKVIRPSQRFGFRQELHLQVAMHHVPPFAFRRYRPAKCFLPSNRFGLRRLRALRILPTKDNWRPCAPVEVLQSRVVPIYIDASSSETLVGTVARA